MNTINAAMNWLAPTMMAMTFSSSPRVFSAIPTAVKEYTTSDEKMACIDAHRMER